MKSQNFDKLKDLIKENKIIEAKEYLMNVEGFNIQKTDKLIKAISLNLSAMSGNKFENKKSETENVLSEVEKKLVIRLLQLKQKLNAVKYVSKSMNISLDEANKIVDDMEEGPQETKTIIFGDDNSLPAEVNIENESFIELGNAEEPDYSDNQFYRPAKIKRNKSIKNSESKPFTFAKIIERDERKKLRKSNSGCMLMLTIMILSGLIIVSGFYIF